MFVQTFARFAYLRLLYMKHTIDSVREHSPSGWRDLIAKKKKGKERNAKRVDRERENSERTRLDRTGCKDARDRGRVSIICKLNFNEIVETRGQKP